MNNRLPQKIMELDPLLKPYSAILRRRLEKIDAAEKKLTRGEMVLADFASGHEYFGLHRHQNEWIFREWAPNASAVFLVGELSNWQEEPALALQRINAEGVWELRLPADRLGHGDLYRLRIHWADGRGDRIPAYARLDLSLTYKKQYKSWSLAPYLQIFNLGNRKNIWFIQYDEEIEETRIIQKVEPVYMLPLLPTLGVTIEF